MPALELQASNTKHFLQQNRPTTKGNIPPYLTKTVKSAGKKADLPVKALKIARCSLLFGADFNEVSRKK